MDTYIYCILYYMIVKTVTATQTEEYLKNHTVPAFMRQLELLYQWPSFIADYHLYPRRCIGLHEHSDLDTVDSLPVSVWPGISTCSLIPYIIL